jgi:hypothetical protein
MRNWWKVWVEMMGMGKGFGAERFEDWIGEREDESHGFESGGGHGME